MNVDASFELYQRLREYVGFGTDDEQCLRDLAPILIPEQQAVTDAFYEAILREPETAAFVEGRLEGLKRTHAQWFEELFNGVYGREYFERRWQIGLAHVRVGLNPRWVDLTVSHVHEFVLQRLHALKGDEGVRMHRSVARLLELDRTVIQLAFDEDRLDRLSEFTGMKRALIENVVKVAR